MRNNFGKIVFITILSFSITTTAQIVVTRQRAISGSGTGDVVGPGGATDSNFACFDGATGLVIKDCLITSASSAASKLFGRGSASGAGVWQEIAIGSGLTMTGTTLSASGGGVTDATYWVGAAHAGLSAEINLGALGTGLVINTGGTPSIYAGVTCTNQLLRILSASGAGTCATVAYADITAATGASLLLGRGSAAGGGVWQEVTLGTNLSMSGTVLNASAASGAPTDATYITQTANGSLSNEQALGALGTGVMLSTTTTGIVSIVSTQTCTNQFIRVLSAAFSATCATVSLTADVTGDLPFANIAQCATNTVASNITGGTADIVCNTYANLLTDMGVLSCPATGGTDYIPYVKDSDQSCAKVSIGSSLSFSSGTLNLGTTPALGTPASGTLNLPFHAIFLAGNCQNATASSGGNLPTTLGAAGGCQGTTAASGDPAYGVAVFVTGGANTEWHGNFPLPSDWTGNIDISIRWVAATATTNDAVYQVKLGCTANGEAPTSISLNNTALTASTNAGNLLLNTASKTSITTTGCAAAEHAFFIVDRDTDTSGDTLDADVQVLTIDFTYRRAVVIGG